MTEGTGAAEAKSIAPRTGGSAGVFDTRSRCGVFGEASALLPGVREAGVVAAAARGQAYRETLALAATPVAAASSSSSSSSSTSFSAVFFLRRFFLLVVTSNTAAAATTRVAQERHL